LVLNKKVVKFADRNANMYTLKGINSTKY